MAEDEADRRGLKPMARIVDYAGAALAPEWFTIAPLEAIKRVLKLTGLSIKDLELFEINEAFSSVSLAINRELGLDPAKVKDRKSTRLNSSHDQISYAVFCLKKKNQDLYHLS